MPTRAVVFDLFKTLVYLERESHPYRRMFQRLGLTPEEMVQARKLNMTKNFPTFISLAQALRPGINIDCGSFENDLQGDLNRIKLYPETHDVLRDLFLDGFKLGLISNLAMAYRDAFLKLRISEFFQVTIFSCDVGAVKPDPLLYRKMIEALSCEPSQILMTGDQFSKDVEAPRLAGMRAVHLDRSGKSIECITSLEGIFQYL